MIATVLLFPLEIAADLSLGEKSRMKCSVRPVIWGGSTRVGVVPSNGQSWIIEEFHVTTDATFGEKSGVGDRVLEVNFR